MRYTPYRGLSQVTNWVRLKFATMNLKKYALHRWKRSHQYSALINLYTFFAKTKLITLNLAWNLGLFDRLRTCNRKCYFQLYSPYGEWYCCAVIFGFLPSDIRFASVSDEYNITVPQAQYHFCVGKNITPSAARHITISLQVKSFMI